MAGVRAKKASAETEAAAAPIRKPRAKKLAPSDTVPSRTLPASKSEQAVAPDPGEEEGEGADPKLKNMVKPVANAIRILRYLGQSGRPARAVHIARDLKINASTCFNILRTLVAEGVIDFNHIAKTYTIGFGIVKIAESVLSEGERVSAVKPYMRELAERFGVTVTLWRRVGEDRIAQIAAENSSADLRILMTPGRRVPMLMGATGRILATQLGLSKAQVRAAFKTIRWARMLSFETFWEEAERAAEKGYAVDDGYFSIGTMNIAAPVLDMSGAFAFSLVAVMFRGQYDDGGVAKLGEELKRLGQQLTSVLY